MIQEVTRKYVRVVRHTDERRLGLGSPSNSCRIANMCDFKMLQNASKCTAKCRPVARGGGGVGGVVRPPPVAHPKDFVPPFSNFVPPFSNFVPPFSNFVPPFSNFVPPFSNFVPPFSNFVPPFSNFVPPLEYG